MSTASKPLAAAIAMLCCSGTFGQSTTPGTPAPTTASQATPMPATTPATTTSNNPAPTPANRPTPTTSSPTTTGTQPPAQFPSAAQQPPNNTARGASSAANTNLSRCAALTGIPKAECERRDAPSRDLPAGVTPSQMERQAQREAEAASNEARERAQDSMRPAPTSAPPATHIPAPPASAPPPGPTQPDADTLNRPRR